MKAYFIFTSQNKLLNCPNQLGSSYDGIQGQLVVHIKYPYKQNHQTDLTNLKWTHDDTEISYISNIANKF